MRLAIKIAALKSLLAADGVPMPESALLANVRMIIRPLQCTDSDFRVALDEMADVDRLAEGVTDDFTKERSWTLTTKGNHKARQLK